MSKKNRVALVTGGAKRVGRAIVERLHAGGFDVCFTYHSSQSEADELASKINGMAIAVDLRQPESAVAEVMEKFKSRFDRLDVLVNNASQFGRGSLDETTPTLLRQMTALHLETPVLLCKAFASMLRASRGHVVNMIDLLAEKPWPEYVAYCASKAALANATLSLARSLAPEVTVNGIAPGVVEWPNDYPQHEREKYLQRVPLQRPGTPEDVAELVHFLATGGSYITGQIIRLDGGRSIT